MGAFEEIFTALTFAAEQHKRQRRKGFISIPYINHPICVANLLINIAGSEDVAMVQAALLHDLIEDTGITVEEVEQKFGVEVSQIVWELTDDKSLPSLERKRLQVEFAPKLSPKAKLIRIADKVCNLQDLINYPIGWSRKRKIAYVEWSREVVRRCTGVNGHLESLFEETASKALNHFQQK